MAASTMLYSPSAVASPLHLTFQPRWYLLIPVFGMGMTNFPFPSIGNTESTVSNFLMEKTPQPCGTHGLGIIFRKMTSGVFHPLYLPYWFKEEKRDRGRRDEVERGE